MAGDHGEGGRGPDVGDTGREDEQVGRATRSMGGGEHLRPPTASPVNQRAGPR